ncbi:double-strand break repair protein AddB [Parapontixanthobacter aurantiacus]|uniref:double-strand break repair protein AddB n=1 Tax=Parapontixanthobacter aurantiacus TaxID=1463599 RepID=UPI001926EBBC|nr:double-strand break repair protein AddB [Parapontixanthobacter aurantiacus]
MIKSHPDVYSVAAHRGFADALVAGLVPRYADDISGMANLTLLLPSGRAKRTVGEAFVRLLDQNDRRGMLLPRMAVIGDIELDEALGHLLDPLGSDDLLPAVDPMRRWLTLTDLIAEEWGEDIRSDAARLRMARDMAATMDRLLIEEVAPDDLLGEPVLDLLGDLAQHWTDSLRMFARIQFRWRAKLEEWGRVDLATRRNALFAKASERWSRNPPHFPIVAAGITSASPGIARLLRTIAFLPQGSVILPDLDLAMPDDVWDELGSAGAPTADGSTPFSRDDAVTHPQYHLKLLLNRMGVARGEVRPWHRKGDMAGPPARSHAISSLFLPPKASRIWAQLPPEKRRLAGIRIMESANPEGEAQAVALLVREALETPAKQIAVVTPDRNLAARIAEHCLRWNIVAEDSAGKPLSITAAGRLVLLLAETVAENAAPVPLVSLFSHPLVDGGGDRGIWLRRVRELELLLRGPRPEGGLRPIEAMLTEFARKRKSDEPLGWWQVCCDALENLFALAERERIPIAECCEVMIEAGEKLCGERLWAREDGRALSQFLDDLRRHAWEAGTIVAISDLPAILSDAMERIAVRPPYGGHSRVAIYGLLESRMARADVMICAGLNEGTWPAGATMDANLAAPVLRALGVPGPDYRIGLSAHDLASALGAPEVVLSRARRDESGPAIASRFLLRVEALINDPEGAAKEARMPELARRLDAPTEALPAYERPAPRPSPAQRDVPITVTALDRLRGDPYQFYASSILQLRSLDALDAAATPAWQGNIAHDILQKWHEEGQRRDIVEVADEVLEATHTGALTIALWRPRLIDALRWIALSLEGDDVRTVLAVERKGEMIVDDVRIYGRADRIDRMGDGTLGIVDYKTGKPPSAAMVEKGFALQLGLLGLIARQGGFEDISGEPECFEYWSLGKSAKSETGFGYVETPLKVDRKRSGIAPDDFLPVTEGFLRGAIADWIKGDAAFTARLNPDYPAYNDYDQLMRLDEWLPRLAEEETE